MRFARVRIASGSLGQGLSVAIGACEAKKLNNDPHIVYSLHGDGELQEAKLGSNYVCIRKIDNLIATIDLNGKQIDGKTDDVLSLGNIKSKFLSFDWKAIEIENGNDIESIYNGVNLQTMTGNNTPICILLKTEMGNGVDFMMNTHAWHGKAPNDEQLIHGLSQNPETLGDF